LIFFGVPRPPALGTEVCSNRLEIHLGGGAIITAQHLDDLGSDLALAAFLSAPPIRDYCSQILQKSRLDTSLCTPAEAGIDPQITVANSDPQDRAFLARRSDPSQPVIVAGDFTCHKHPASSHR